MKWASYLEMCKFPEKNPKPMFCYVGLHKHCDVQITQWTFPPGKLYLSGIRVRRFYILHVVQKIQFYRPLQTISGQLRNNMKSRWMNSWRSFFMIGERITNLSGAIMCHLTFSWQKKITAFPLLCKYAFLACTSIGYWIPLLHCMLYLWH